jgi:hypothetical protein
MMTEQSLISLFNQFRVAEHNAQIHHYTREMDVFVTSPMQLWETENNEGHFICVTYDVHADSSMLTREIFPATGMYSIRCIIGFPTKYDLDMFVDRFRTIRDLIFSHRGGMYNRMTYANLTGEIIDRLIQRGDIGHSFISLSSQKTD